ncbi:MAG TPA: response regulator [Bacteriovoracaceae bacterium]|nr:response regulator [Bacteriovoracaceae bacterium]
MTEQYPTCHSILIVDDDEDIRNAMSDVLEMEGHHTIQAANGKEALEIIANNTKPCLVLLDMMMPVMNGREFLDVVIASGSLTPLPVVIVSAHASIRETEGAVGFLKKPVNIDAILKVASQYCGKSASPSP